MGGGGIFVRPMFFIIFFVNKYFSRIFSHLVARYFCATFVVQDYFFCKKLAGS